MLEKESCFIRDMTVLNCIPNTLADNNIPSFVCTHSMTNPGWSHGLPFIDASAAYEYRAPVRGKGREAAKHCLNR